jgi:Terpene synthase family 2, C-terminal metal binding
LRTTQIPELYCPFPSLISPHVEAVQRQVNQWMQARRYIRTEASLERFNAAKFAWLTGRVHPDASYESILMVATYMSWLFMVDDLYDEAALGRDPERLKVQHQEFIERMKNPRPLSGEESPLVAGLVDIWERMRLNAPPGWAQRFIQTFEGYAYACVWEAENRVSNRVSPLGEYMEFRRHTSALYVFFSLIELVEQVTLTPEVIAYIHELEVRANDGVCWVNDMLSLEKEARAGDVHNLVIVLQHEQGLSVQEAMNQAASLFNTRMREYVEFEQRLPSFGVELDVPLQRYLKGLRCWVRGNIDWSYESGRYEKTLSPSALTRAAS